MEVHHKRFKRPDDRRPPLRPLVFPSDVLLLVFKEVLVVFDTYQGRYSPLQRHDLTDAARNAILASFALVSRDWYAVAIALLYGDLRLEWRKSNATKLLQTVALDPGKNALFRRVKIRFITFSDWEDVWKGSEQGRAAEKAAWDRWPVEEWEEWGEPEGWYPFLVGCAEADARRAGEDWHASAAGRREGSDALWTWISLLSDLDELVVASLDQPVSLPLRRRLAPVLSSLTLVNLEDVSDDVAAMIQLLDNVETLYLRRVEAPKPATARKRPPTLRFLHISTLDGDSIHLLHLFPANLVALDIDQWYNSRPDTLALILPSLQNLQSLGLPFRANDITIPFLSVLSTTTISHLLVQFWPSPSLIPLFPKSLQTLLVTVPRYAPPVSQDEVEEALRWRERHLPELASLVLQIQLPATDDLDGEWEGIEARAVGFTLSISHWSGLAARPTVEGQWWGPQRPR